jgi:hypothetical protein
VDSSHRLLQYFQLLGRDVTRRNAAKRVQIPAAFTAVPAWQRTWIEIGVYLHLDAMPASPLVKMRKSATRLVKVREVAVV